jgi:hypothetical protein
MSLPANSAHVGLVPRLFIMIATPSHEHREHLPHPDNKSSLYSRNPLGVLLNGRIGPNPNRLAELLGILASAAYKSKPRPPPRP